MLSDVLRTNAIEVDEAGVEDAVGLDADVDVELDRAQPLHPGAASDAKSMRPTNDLTEIILPCPLRFPRAHRTAWNAA